jgi:hypothetical protein
MKSYSGVVRWNSWVQMGWVRMYERDAVIFGGGGIMWVFIVLEVMLLLFTGSFW